MTQITVEERGFLQTVAARAAEDAAVIDAVASKDMDALRAEMPRLMRETIKHQDTIWLELNRSGGNEATDQLTALLDNVWLTINVETYG